MNIYFSWIVSVCGLFLSLYYGEWSHLEPCRFCWFQRIALFPLALQLGIAAYYSDVRGAIRYGIPLASFGFLCGALQIVLPELLPLSCGCSVAKSPHLFDLIPLPWISTFGFLLIVLLLSMNRKESLS